MITPKSIDIGINYLPDKGVKGLKSQTETMKILSLTLLIFVSIACPESSVDAGCETTGAISQDTSREADEKLLQDLYSEIESLSKEFSCSDANEWKFTEIGSKACGGPAGYIVYNVNQDTECFLKKVRHYTSLTATFNDKYGVISDCSIAPIPSGIECMNGEAVLDFID
ncbi:hypothetical protein [Jiulongibacter sediminis]|uniref:Uncharacterized protein n=1 Tax=Jiulongibacter sediminis TaxID=1605367 RepID=A0A0P7B922_9BACT|nr:hypothetical protein [Jiulongibacter sediminis]KPM46839.1 hypothetical protein AFM12_16480 [Jiulongibacter sediminis]TBX22189.1 hypothetical protein TK44_16490 [Jiulongibacter sediminis]